MILIIGGCAQGKLAFAVRELGVKEYDEGKVGDRDCLYRLHEAVRAGATRETLDAYLVRHPDAVILCDEVGCGIVPVEQEERAYREATGRLCCYLAERAERVYRVFCGIGTRIK